MENEVNNTPDIDLFDIQPVTRSFEVKHPVTKDNIGLRISLKPPSHPDVRKAQRKNLDRQLSGRSGKVTAASVEENTLSLLIAAIDSWDWYGTTFKGEKPEMNERNIRMVFNGAVWIRDQVKDEFDDAESFFGE